MIAHMLQVSCSLPHISLQEPSVQVEKAMSDLLARTAKLHDAASKLSFTDPSMDADTRTR